MTPSKRPLTLKPLPTTSQPKAMLAKKPLPTAAKPAKLSSPKAPRERGNRPRWIWAVAIAVFLLVGVGGAYAMGYIGHRDPLADMRNMRAQLDDPNVPTDTKRAIYDQMQSKEQGLSKDQRQEWGEDRSDRRDIRDGRQMQKFFAMSPEDQQKELNSILDKWQKDHPDSGTGAGGTGKGNGGDNSGDSQGGRGGRGGRGAGGSSDPTQANAAHDRRLSSTTGTSRADWHAGKEMKTVYKNMLNTAAAQRGISLPPNGIGGGGGMGGRRGR